MQKLNFKLYRNFFFIFIAVVLGIILSYSYYFRGKYLSSVEEDKGNILLGFHTIDTNIKINQKTPRNLFAKYLRSSLLAWCGYYRAFTSGVECISPGTPDDENYYSLQNKWKNKLLPLSYSLIATDFSLNDIPASASGDKCSVVLGTGKNRQTFYLAKDKNDNWYFTEENFNDPETTKKYNRINTYKNKLQSGSIGESSPLGAYALFLLGCQNKYGFTFKDAQEVMDIDWIDPMIREKYSRFLAFLLFKVLVTKKIGVWPIPVVTPPSEQFILLYTSRNLPVSIYLQKKNINKEGIFKWWFNKKTLMSAYNIYTHEKMRKTAYDPFWVSIESFLWINFRPLFYSTLGVSCYTWLRIILGIFLFYFCYNISRWIIKKILFFIRMDKSIYRYEIYAERLGIFSALAISLFCFEKLNNSIFMFYYSFYLFFVYFLTVAYGILLILWLCNAINLICAIIGYILKQKSNTKFQIGFTVEIIKRLANILIIIVFSGLLLSKLGVNMIQFLTALGIGGLALAFAGKDTIENLFGSIMIALEKPFNIGDWVIIGEVEGTVETVGLRSTRIRTFEDSYLTVPNVIFITSKVNNMGKRTYRRYNTVLNVDDSTSHELLRAFTEGIDELIQATPSMRKKDYHIRVNDIGESSIKILIYVFFVTIDWGEELKERENFIINIMILAEKLGIKLSFPSQTLYIAKHKKNDTHETSDINLKQLNKKTTHARSMARKIVEKFVSKPPENYKY